MDAHMSAKKMGIVNMAASCSLWKNWGKRHIFPKVQKKT